MMDLPKSRGGWLKLAAIVVAVFLVYQVGKRLVPDIDPQQVLEDVALALGPWTYLIAGALAFLETGAFVGLVAPGETAVVLAGAVAGQGATSIILTIAIVWISAFAGDTCSYLLGRRLGRGFILEHGPRIKITEERFNGVERYFESHGGKTILIGRFIGIVRALAPFIAGSSGMRYGAMAPYSVLGTGLWATAFCLLGYFASRQIDVVIENSEHVLFAFGVIVAVIVGIIVLRNYLRVEENRVKVIAAMERRPVLRSLLRLGRKLAPQLRFLRARLTPGDLGLELTSALAALAVGSFVVIGYALVLDGNLGPTPGDSQAFDVVDRLRAGWLTDVAKVVTALGSTAVIVAVTALFAGWLGWRRHWPELAVLLGGTVAIFVGVDLLKDLIARPRPADPLVSASGFSYPSGHAAHAVVYPWIALTASLRLRTGTTRGSGLFVAGVAVAVVVGLSRVYLRVHYMSDVSGGWGLGAALFALGAAIAVIVVFIRQNSRDVP